MGKGDRKTGKGKRAVGSYGKTRKKASKNSTVAKAKPAVSTNKVKSKSESNADSGKAAAKSKPKAKPAKKESEAAKEA